MTVAEQAPPPEQEEPAHSFFERFPALQRLGESFRRRQIPFIAQLSAVDCAAACLAMVLGFPPTTHLIDPDVDEARQGLLQDLAYSQALAKFGYVKGVGACSRSAPRGNLTNDPYFTDGLRAVLFFGKRPMTLDKVALLDWELPAERVPVPSV